MANPGRDQFRPLFGAIYEQLRVAPDWGTLTDVERGDRLREAMLAEDQKYGRRPRFDAEFDFVHVVQALALPDVR